MIKRPNFILIGIVCFFVVAQILVLKPAKIETAEETTTSMFKSMDSMTQAQKLNDEVGYTIDGFHYTAVEGEVKHWELHATQAILYEKSKLVRSKNARIKMFDAEGKITLIEGDEADYKMNEKDLDLSGHVKVTFPDGFWLRTSKARYTAKMGEISSQEPFNGETASSKDELMQMSGIGFRANKLLPDVDIMSAAKVKMRRLDSGEVTDVASDRARIDRFKKFAFFTMKDSTRFVESHQGTLHVRSRRQEATYDSSASVLKYMTALGDVLIKETDPKKGATGLKYATSQKADFLTKEDKILLSGFPSAYQEHDTLTGELIVIYRKQNLVEVTHANAFHEGGVEEEATE